MTPLKSGDRILVPVKADQGAFPGECLITFDTLDGPISGFIERDQVRTQNDRTFVPAQVLEVDDNQITVRLHGSFFTTSGLAHIGRDAPFLKAA